MQDKSTPSDYRDYTDRIITSKEPIRLFQSDFLEFFSHITPQVVLLIWLPISGFFLIHGIYLNVQANAALWPIPLVIFCGWFVWTLVEYFVHRFIFHYHPKTERLKRFFFTFHGMHHAQPMCKTRLVMPPVISIPLSILFFGLFYLITVSLLEQPLWLEPAFSGFAIGYLVYDMIHYSLHHMKSKKGYLAMCRRQHMRHHVKCPNMRFGVSFPLWDYVFGTMPVEGFLRKHKNTRTD